MKRIELICKIAALSALSIALTATSAGATAAPGDHAQKSAVYREFVANCRRPSTKPSLEDEAAKKLEAMTKEQRLLQIEACQANQRAAEKYEAPPQQEATNLPPAAYVGAGAAAARGIFGNNRHRGGPPPGGQLSPEQEAQLEQLLAAKSVEKLGPRPPGSRGYVGDKPGHMRVPPGCTERRVADYHLRRYFVRVVCR